MNQPATIKLFLVNGTPNGLRTAELSNWSGKAVSAPRSDLKQLLSRPELASQGIYFLTGTDSESGMDAIYVGEAEDVSVRLKGHSEKDYWNQATVFVSKDDNLTKSHIRYLEGILIEKLINRKDIFVGNSASSGSKLPEADASEMDIFLEKCMQLLPVLGVSHFESIRQMTEKDDAEAFTFSTKGAIAKGRRTEKGFVICEGSTAVKDYRPSAKGSKRRREKLVEQGILKETEGFLVFTCDYLASSPSEAGSHIAGGATNGLMAWKNSKGQTLKQLEAEN